MIPIPNDQSSEDFNQFEEENIEVSSTQNPPTKNILKSFILPVKSITSTYLAKTHRPLHLYSDLKIELNQKYSPYKLLTSLLNKLALAQDDCSLDTKDIQIQIKRLVQHVGKNMGQLLSPFEKMIPTNFRHINDYLLLAMNCILNAHFKKQYILMAVKAVHLIVNDLTETASRIYQKAPMYLYYLGTFLLNLYLKIIKLKDVHVLIQFMLMFQENSIDILFRSVYSFSYSKRHQETKLVLRSQLPIAQQTNKMKAIFIKLNHLIIKRKQDMGILLHLQYTWTYPYIYDTLVSLTTNLIVRLRCQQTVTQILEILCDFIIRHRYYVQFEDAQNIFNNIVLVLLEQTETQKGLLISRPLDYMKKQNNSKLKKTIFKLQNLLLLRFPQMLEEMLDTVSEILDINSQNEINNNRVNVALLILPKLIGQINEDKQIKKKFIQMCDNCFRFDIFTFQQKGRWLNLLSHLPFDQEYIGFIGQYLTIIKFQSQSEYYNILLMKFIKYCYTNAIVYQRQLADKTTITALFDEMDQKKVVIPMIGSVFEKFITNIDRDYFWKFLKDAIEEKSYTETILKHLTNAIIVRIQKIDIHMNRQNVRVGLNLIHRILQRTVQPNLENKHNPHSSNLVAAKFTVRVLDYLYNNLFSEFFFDIVKILNVYIFNHLLEPQRQKVYFGRACQIFQLEHRSSYSAFFYTINFYLSRHQSKTYDSIIHNLYKIPLAGINLFWKYYQPAQRLSQQTILGESLLLLQMFMLKFHGQLCGERLSGIWASVMAIKCYFPCSSQQIYHNILNTLLMSNLSNKQILAEVYQKCTEFDQYDTKVLCKALFSYTPFNKSLQVIAMKVIKKILIDKQKTMSNKNIITFTNQSSCTKSPLQKMKSKVRAQWTAKQFNLEYIVQCFVGIKRINKEELMSCSYDEMFPQDIFYMDKEKISSLIEIYKYPKEGFKYIIKENVNLQQIMPEEDKREGKRPMEMKQIEEEEKESRCQKRYERQ